MTAQSVQGERASALYLYFSVAIGVVALGALLLRVLIDGFGFVDDVLLFNPPSSNPDKAGARPAILATVWLLGLVFAMAVPGGIATALWLEEFAKKDRWYNRFLELNIQNLAGVPSIVYGILGLAFLVRGLGLGRVLLAGAMILALLVLPTVIISSREALRAVPDSIRQGGLALGATRWQVTFRVGAAGGAAGHRDRVDPRPLARDRRVGTAGADRRAHVRGVRPVAARRLHGPARPDLPVDRTAAAGVQVARRRRDHRAPRHTADDERRRDPAPQQVPEEVVNPDMDATAAPIRVGAQEALSASPALPPIENREVVFGIRSGSVHYGSHLALKEVDIDIYRNFVTAFIGPSGCGKSTFLRCLNRLNDLIPTAKVGGDVHYHGEDLYASTVDPVEVRKRIGMVFQKPNPFPKSIYDNTAFGPARARA